uniref:Uncharacterized protein n=1 Tax=Anguilla anguilla TaxID=7936 RepID=A0A0E9QFR0_ANGAN
MAGALSPDPVLLCLSSLPRSLAIAPLAAVSPSLPNRFFLRCPGSFPLSLPPSLPPSLRLSLRSPVLLSTVPNPFAVTLV